MKNEIKLTPGTTIELEFMSDEIVKRAKVIERREEVLGWGWRFQIGKKFRWVYEKDMEQIAPAYILVEC